MRQELYLLGEENGADGKTVQVQVQNADVMMEYELNQVGVYAALDVNKDKDDPAPVQGGFDCQHPRCQTVVCAGVRVVGGNGPLQYFPQPNWSRRVASQTTRRR